HPPRLRACPGPRAHAAPPRRDPVGPLSPHPSSPGTVGTPPWLSQPHPTVAPTFPRACRCWLSLARSTGMVYTVTSAHLEPHIEQQRVGRAAASAVLLLLPLRKSVPVPVHVLRRRSAARFRKDDPLRTCQTCQQSLPIPLRA